MSIHAGDGGVSQKQYWARWREKRESFHADVLDILRSKKRELRARLRHA